MLLHVEGSAPEIFVAKMYSTRSWDILDHSGGGVPLSIALECS